MINWYTELEFFKSNTFKKIVEFLKEEESNGKTILPAKPNILKAFSLTPIQQVKVVILGQDPYPNASHAIGLAFAVGSDVKPLPHSLLNIFRELKDDIGVERTNGDLSDWATQGVLLLNASLTVVARQSGSHKKIGWNTLVREVIDYLNTHHDHIVYILWGQHAFQYLKYINQNKACVIKSAHPSPLSASRGFFGSKPFSSVNNYLISKNISPIVW